MFQKKLSLVPGAGIKVAWVVSGPWVVLCLSLALTQSLISKAMRLLAGAVAG